MEDTKLIAYHLAQVLKGLCNEKGQEKEKYIVETSTLLSKMALLYKRTPNHDKISLIQSAALLNAAIVRQPENQEFLNELKQLCSHVLKTAKSSQSLLEAKHEEVDEDLVEFSFEIATKVKNMRDSAKAHLNGMDDIPYDATDEKLREMELKKIEEMKVIQSKITDDYTQIMNNISDKCIAVLGKPPCKYTLVGMGSLARREITPYSDFEHIIVLEDGIQGSTTYETVLEYFRWYSTIFLIILVNLRETILKFLTIPFLNDVLTPDGNWFYDAFTPCGISPDGFHPAACKTPLGRTQETKDKKWTTEFIKPASEMARFLDSKVCVREGYHIASMLRETCFVSGDEDVYKSFVDQVQAMLKNNAHFYSSQVKNELNEDRKRYSAYTELSKLLGGFSCDIKRMVYRTSTLFVSTMGKMENLEECSCFDIIAALQKKKTINDESAHKLSYAVALSCQARLIVYSERKAQDDYLRRAISYFPKEESVFPGLNENFKKILGTKSWVDFLLTVCNLQLFFLNNNNLNNFDSCLIPKPSVKFQVLSSLQLYNRVVEEWDWRTGSDSPKEDPHLELLIKSIVSMAYLKLEKYESAVEMSEFTFNEAEEMKDLDIAGQSLYIKASSLHGMKDYDSAITFIEYALEILKKQPCTDSSPSISLELLIALRGLCKSEVDSSNETALAFKDLAISFQKKEKKPTDIFSAWTCIEAGALLVRQELYAEALESLQLGIPFVLQTPCPIQPKCNCLTLLGTCFMKLERYKEALEQFENELQWRLEYVPSEQKDTDPDIQRAQSNISKIQEILERQCTNK